MIENALRRHVVNDCCRRRLASSVKMAQYPNLHFVVSDGSDIGSGRVDFDVGTDDLSLLGHW